VLLLFNASAKVLAVSSPILLLPRLQEKWERELSLGLLPPYSPYSTVFNVLSLFNVLARALAPITPI
jgi:hypothetical protein